MQKTHLDENLRLLFNSTEEITKETIQKYIDIREVNKNGTVLHAALNYDYPKEKRLKFIEIALDEGVDPNHKSLETGLTFLHLALYGYTDDLGIDHSYDEEYLVHIITLAKKYGFDSTIKDNDGETVAMAAIASEVYTGRIDTILEALEVKVIDKTFMECYEKYIKIACMSNQEWYTRLMLDKGNVESYIQRINIIAKANFLEVLEKAEEICKDINYRKLKPVAKTLAELFHQMHDLKSQVGKNEKKRFANLQIQISEILCTACKNIADAPMLQDIEEMEKFVAMFEALELKDYIEQIKKEYMNYLPEVEKIVRESGTTIDSICMLMITKKNENINRYLSPVLQEKLKKINDVIAKIKMLLSLQEEPERVNNPDFESKIATSYDYDNLTLEELQTIEDTIRKDMESYREYVLNCYQMQYEELYRKFVTGFEYGVLTPEDIIAKLTMVPTNHSQKGIK